LLKSEKNKSPCHKVPPRTGERVLAKIDYTKLLDMSNYKRLNTNAKNPDRIKTIDVKVRGVGVVRGHFLSMSLVQSIC
jgi:hypothetical protein